MIFKFLRNNCTHSKIRKIKVEIEEHLCDCCNKQLFVDEKKNSEIYKVMEEKKISLKSGAEENYKNFYIPTSNNSISKHLKELIGIE